MKKHFLMVISSILVTAGCSLAIPVPNPPEKTDETKKETKSEEKVNVKDYSNSAAVKLIASVSVSSKKGADTPLDEASEKLKKISKVTVSVFDEKMKLLDILNLSKDDASVKGEIYRFTTGFRAFPKGKLFVKYAFFDKEQQTLFNNETEFVFKEKNLYQVTSSLEQESILVNSAGDLKTNKTIVDEITEAEYAKGQMNIGVRSDAKLTPDELKKLLTDRGIKVTEMKGIGVPGTYNVSFSEPDTSSALIIASLIDKLEYAEQNGVVSIQLF